MGSCVNGTGVIGVISGTGDTGVTGHAIGFALASWASHCGRFDLSPASLIVDWQTVTRRSGPQLLEDRLHADDLPDAKLADLDKGLTRR